MGTTEKSPTQRRYPPELKERAIRMVFEVRAETGQKGGSLQRVPSQLGIGIESLRAWVNQAEVDGGRPGTTTADAARIAELEQQNRELPGERDPAIGGGLLAGELDPRPRR